MPYHIVTVTGSHRTGFGLQVEPAVPIKALAARVADTDVPVRGDTLLLLFPEGRRDRAILADFGLEAWREADTYYSRSSPDDPEFTLTIGTERGPENLPPGTEIWLDDAAPTGGARSGGWSRIIAQFEALPWVKVDPDPGPVDRTRQVVGLVDDALGPDVIGTYLHGSSVLGELRPASDLDVLVVSRRRMNEQERRALLDGLLQISGSRNNARPVELTVIVQSEVRPWRYPPTGDFLYGEWLRTEYESGQVPQPEPMPDLALLITMALAGDHPLTGPRPADALDPVPQTDLIRASVAGIPGLLDDLDSDTRNVLLTFARIWTTLATGQIKSKDAAADWALAQLPPELRPVLEHARQLYLDCPYSEESWSDALRAQVRPHVDHVLAEINRLYARIPRL
ncbi:putative nucleotidyltransferase [Streptomyces sp. SAI-149]|nr:putative nucleotidyltransferase [Streptomyces sp. SAI-149]